MEYLYKGFIMEFTALLAALTKIVLTYGTSALGWVVSAVLAWVMVRKKQGDDKSIDNIQTKLLETKDEYINKVQAMNDKLGELNLKHAEVISHISEKRVEDLKDLTEEYNKLATSTLRTLDKFVVAIEVSNGFKRSKRSSEDNNND